MLNESGLIGPVNNSNVKKNISLNTNDLVEIFFQNPHTALLKKDKKAKNIFQLKQESGIINKNRKSFENFNFVPEYNSDGLILLHNLNFDPKLHKETYNYIKFSDINLGLSSPDKLLNWSIETLCQISEKDEPITLDENIGLIFEHKLRTSGFVEDHWNYIGIIDYENMESILLKNQDSKISYLIYNCPIYRTLNLFFSTNNALPINTGVSLNNEKNFDAKQAIQQILDQNQNIKTS